MLHSIATVSLSGTLPEKLKAISDAGFDGVEIFENDLLYFDGRPGDVKRMAGDLGLQIYLFQPFRDFEGVPADRLKQNLLRAQRKFDLMHELGASKILVCSNVGADTIPDDELIIDQLGQLAELAATHGITVGYEALAWGKHVNSYRHAWRLVDAVSHSNLGLILDSFHTFSIQDDLDLLSSIPGERIVFVQIADAPILAMDVLEWSRHFRCFPGQGGFPLPDFLAPILGAGYTGPLSLEVFNDGFRASPTRATADDGLRSLLFLEEQTAAQLVSGKNKEPVSERRTNAASIADALFSPPKPPQQNGFEFLEFAVDDATSVRMGDWLTRLGFKRAGRHKSKNVTLYMQGATWFILNAEPDSLASTFFEAHGLSLCAVAFNVADAGSALRRATEYRYQSFTGRVGPGERVVPCVRAPDKSLVYLVGADPGQTTIYENDFLLTDIDGPAHPGPLQRVDHIALAIPAESLDAWVLFYRTAFGFQAESASVLPDPYGLVRSQALRSGGGRIRVTLNTSDDRNTAIARSLSTYRGSGLQHLALATSDIFQSVKMMQQAGVPLLRIPNNYYDDLAARFGLTDEFVRTLSERNILYDRDGGGGEFLHVYSEQLESRFFFEVLERRNGYDLYGAANAPVRMAAHARQIAAPGPQVELTELLTD
jgi:4-hydroxyphenylpyruvate dioxygenase